MRTLAAVMLVAGIMSSQTQAQAYGQNHRSACERHVRQPALCRTIEADGHRAVQGPDDNSNENTLWALRRDHKVGAGCESDTWRLKGPNGVSTGRNVIFHDDRLGRIIPHDLLAKYGLSPEDGVGQVTWEVWQKLVTTGGEHLTDLQTWLRKMGQWHVPCKIEVKYVPANPGQVMQWVRQYHAPASFYALPVNNCGQHAVTVMKEAGAKIGLKYNHRCPMSPAQIAAFGYDYVVTAGADITRNYVKTCHALGIKVGNYNARGKPLWTYLVNAGADFIIAPHPGRLARWLRGGLR